MLTFLERLTLFVCFLAMAGVGASVVYGVPSIIHEGAIEVKEVSADDMYRKLARQGSGETFDFAPTALSPGSTEGTGAGTGAAAGSQPTEGGNRPATGPSPAGRASGDGPPPQAAPPGTLLRRLQDEGKQPDKFITFSPEVTEKYASSLQETQHLMMQAASTILPNGEGVQIEEIDRGSLIEKTTLQPGDIIKSVNGIPIRGAVDGPQLYDSLRGQREFVLEIVRRGRSMRIYYAIGN